MTTLPASTSWKARAVLRAAVAGVLVLVAVLSWLLGNDRVVLNFELASQTGQRGEVFYGGRTGYEAGRSVGFPVIEGSEFRSHRIVVPAEAGLDRLRVDIGDQPGAFSLRQLDVRVRVGLFEGPAHPVDLGAAALNDATPVAATAGELVAQASGHDPYVDLALPSGTMGSMQWWSRGVSAVIALLAAGLAAAAMVLATVIGRRVGLRHRLARLRWPPALSTLATRLSDPGAIRLEPSSLAVLLVALLLAAGGIAAKLNFSSIAMWDVFLPGSAASAPLLGEPRAIRSDEWRVQTPWILSQSAQGMPVDNTMVGGERAPLLASVPVRHPVTVLQPEFWGLLLFDIERGVSWFWMFKAVGLFVSAFLLLLLLTRNDVPVSLLSALWISLSSYTQWWFSSNLAEMLTGFCLALTGLGYVCLARRTWAMCAGFVALLLGSATFVFQLYPAYQVPLGYLALTIAVAVALDPSRRSAFMLRPGLRVVLLAAAAAVLGFVLISLWSAAGETIGAMTATAYPGQRVSVGGDLSWRRVFDGLFESWRLDERVYPYPHLNASEASNYALLFPLVLLAMGWAWARTRSNALLVALAAFCCVIAGWMIIELPTGFAHALSRATLLSYVSATRALPALGMASILLCATWMAWQRTREGQEARRVPAWAWALLLIAFYHQGALTMGDDPAYFTGWRIMLGCALLAVSALAIGRGDLKAYAAVVIALALPSLMVNPLNRGLDALLEKPVLAQAVADSRGVEDPRWLVIGSGIAPQAFKAAGLQVFGGTLLLPDFHAMQVLDPARTSSQVWNRYAHVAVESVPGRAAPRFNLDHQDAYTIELDVCAVQLDRLGINLLAYVGEPPLADQTCLQSLGPAVNGISLYRRAPGRPQNPHRTSASPQGMLP